MRLFIACMLTLVIYIMICVCEQKGKEVPKVSQQLKIDKDYPTVQQNKIQQKNKKISIA